jgi:hypothetical protein
MSKEVYKKITNILRSNSILNVSYTHRLIMLARYLEKRIQREE